MELNGEVFYWILVTYFTVRVFTTFRVKYLLKINYPEQHDKLYGKSLPKYYISRSMKSARFVLSEKEWEFVQDDQTLAWLKSNRFITLTYFVFIFFIAMYLFAILI